ncbi:MAG TPA: phosphoglycerate mutase family protein [Candidatus Dormibacteraeota bacterium]|nr:phosphoglycerate mutase family protein [Candidatus Dormibacteraeota bacterium]
MAIYVVRHAKAGDRGEWEGDDQLRPLTKSGHRQADELAGWLRKEPIDAILSSPYVRCLQTLEPLAEQRKLPIKPRTDLAEGAGGESILRMAAEFKGRNVVLCTHGDVVEELLEHLIADGLVARAHAQLEKGSTWILDEKNGRIARATYQPAP